MKLGTNSQVNCSIRGMWRGIICGRSSLVADSWTTRPADANTYSLVATIDLARGEGKNPEVPKWLQPGYDNAISALERSASVNLQLRGRWKK